MSTLSSELCHRLLTSTWIEYKLSELDLGSNIGHIPSRSLGWLKPMPASTSDEEIRRELEDKGVVHVKGVMDRDLVLNMRKQ